VIGFFVCKKGAKTEEIVSVLDFDLMELYGFDIDIVWELLNKNRGKPRGFYLF